MKTVTDVNTVNQLLTYSKQAEAGIHQKAIQMLLGAGNNKKQDSLSISDAARGFSKQSIAALIDKNANISNSELAYYFANYNNSSAILDAINFGENVSCGYNSDFKEYGVISFDLNGSRQVVPNYAVPKMNTSTMSGICAANNSLVLSNKSYYAWTTSSGGKYTWTVNNGRIGWAASESLLAENTNQKGTNYKWEMRKASNILSDLAQGKSVWGYLYSNEEVLSVCEKVGISPGFFSIDAGAGKHTYLLQESGKTINVDAKIKQLNDINWIEIGYKEGDTFSVYGKEYAIDSSGHINVSAEDEFTSTEIKYPSTGSWASGQNNNYDRASDFWLTNIVYLRLKELELGYTIPQQISLKAGIKRFRVYFSGTNLITFDNIDIVDPEIDIANGVTYPPTKLVSIGFNATF